MLIAAMFSATIWRAARENDADVDLALITDGAGGYVDLKPAKDTLQFRVNESLKGQTVKWEFELAADVSPNYLGLMMLQPKSATRCPASRSKSSTCSRMKARYSGWESMMS